MNTHAAIIKQFLKDRKSVKVESRGLPFITISRQAGAGGHTLARNILRAQERLLPGEFCEDWEVFDQKLCALIAQDEKLGFSFDALVAEEYRSEISQFLQELILQKATRYNLYKRIFQVVRMLGVLGKCIIVGRAGMCVCADLPRGVHVRLVSSPETRLRNMTSLLETGEDEARKAIRVQDKDRHRLVHDFFGKDIDDPMLYDLVLNMDRMTSEEAAELVVRAMMQKMARFPKRFQHVG